MSAYVSTLKKHDDLASCLGAFGSRKLNTFFDRTLPLAHLPRVCVYIRFCRFNVFIKS